MTTTILVSDDQVADALMQIIHERTGVKDHAGREWLTEGTNDTILGDEYVSTDPAVATLVNAYTVLKIGYVPHY